MEDSLKSRVEILPSWSCSKVLCNWRPTSIKMKIYDSSFGVALFSISRESSMMKPA